MSVEKSHGGIQRSHSAHPMVKVGVVVVGVVLVTMLAMSAAAFIVGLFWTVIKVVLLVALVVGLVHLGRAALRKV